MRARDIMARVDGGWDSKTLLRDVAVGDRRSFHVMETSIDCIFIVPFTISIMLMMMLLWGVLVMLNISPERCKCMLMVAHSARPVLSLLANCSGGSLTDPV